LSESEANILQEISHSAPPISSVIALDVISTLSVNNSAEKSFLSYGTLNRPELGQLARNRTQHKAVATSRIRHFQKFLAGYILFAFHASFQGDSCAIF
jgi:hypothetical protein